MADNLPDAIEHSILNLLLRGTAFTPTTTTVKARLMTTNGSDTAAGTEQTTSQGYTVGGATITFGSAASGGQISNTAAVTWTNMPTCSITGMEIWDTAGTPLRLWRGALAGGTKSVTSGDSFEFAIGAIVCAIS